MLYPYAGDTRELRWTCPECGLIETEIVPMPKQAKQEPSRIEVIELHCDECDRKRMGLSPEWVKPARVAPVNRVFEKSQPRTDHNDASRRDIIKATAESAALIHHGQEVLGRMVLEVLMENEELHQTIAALRTPAVAIPERE